MATQGFERKLTSIFSPKVKGYSRLMDEDDEATVFTITAYRKIITNIIFGEEDLLRAICKGLHLNNTEKEGLRWN
jgi:hypothetical protein